MKRVSIYTKLVLLFAIFLVLAFSMHGNDQSDFTRTILSVASFLFGIMVAFSIANRHSRLNSIKESLREQDAVLISIYYLSKEFGKKISEEIKKRIDELLVNSIDYKLVDWSRGVPTNLRKLYLFLEKIVPKKETQKEIKKKILDCLGDLEKIEKKVEYEVNDSMQAYEWVSLLVLGGIILFCLGFINNGSYISIFIVAFLATALAFLLIVLSEIDKLFWQEEEWIWKPLYQLFTDLDLVPYFPEDVFNSNRLSLKRIGMWKNVSKIRVARYPHPYPDMKGKRVEIMSV